MSGYIDVGHRLAADPAGMAAVWALEARLLPRAGDLSCLNWASGKLDSAASPNFEASVRRRSRAGRRRAGAVTERCCPTLPVCL